MKTVRSLAVKSVWDMSKKEFNAAMKAIRGNSQKPKIILITYQRLASIVLYAIICYAIERKI